MYADDDGFAEERICNNEEGRHREMLLVFGR